MKNNQRPQIITVSYTSAQQGDVFKTEFDHYKDT